MAVYVLPLSGRTCETRRVCRSAKKDRAARYPVAVPGQKGSPDWGKYFWLLPHTVNACGRPQFLNPNALTELNEPAVAYSGNHLAMEHEEPSHQQGIVTAREEGSAKILYLDCNHDHRVDNWERFGFHE